MPAEINAEEAVSRAEDVVANAGDEIREAVAIEVAHRDDDRAIRRVEGADGQVRVAAAGINGAAHRRGRGRGLVEHEFVAAHRWRLAPAGLERSEPERAGGRGGVERHRDIAGTDAREDQRAVVVVSEHTAANSCGGEGHVQISHQRFKRSVGVIVVERDHERLRAERQSKAGRRGVRDTGEIDPAAARPDRARP